LTPFPLGQGEIPGLPQCVPEPIYVILAGEAIPGLDTLVTGVRKTEANYSTFKAHCKARQLKRIEDPLKRAEFWEKLNQGEEPVTRKWVRRGSGRRRQGDP
jgi:hypothetical protein